MSVTPAQSEVVQVVQFDGWTPIIAGAWGGLKGFGEDEYSKGAEMSCFNMSILLECRYKTTCLWCKLALDSVVLGDHMRIMWWTSNSMVLGQKASRARRCCWCSLPCTTDWQFAYVAVTLFISYFFSYDAKDYDHRRRREASLITANVRPAVMTAFTIAWMYTPSIDNSVQLLLKTKRTPTTKQHKLVIPGGCRVQIQNWTQKGRWRHVIVPVSVAV